MSMQQRSTKKQKNTESDKEIASSLQQSHGQIQYVKYERII